MATKIIPTRIRNKIDSYSNWNTENPVLLDGEIGIVRVITQQLDIATGEPVDTPAYLMKVGDGATAFNSLPWVCAKASDVYDWAKGAKAEDIVIQDSRSSGAVSKTLAEWFKTLVEKDEVNSDKLTAVETNYIKFVAADGASSPGVTETGTFQLGSDTIIFDCGGADV